MTDGLLSTQGLDAVREFADAIFMVPPRDSLVAAFRRVNLEVHGHLNSLAVDKTWEVGIDEVVILQDLV